MSWDTWLTITGLAATGFVSVMTWGFITGKWTSTAASDHRYLRTEFEKFEKATTKRFDDANDQMSKLTSYTQGLELKFIRTFADGLLTDERFRENRREHDDMKAQIARFNGGQR